MIEVEGIPDGAALLIDSAPIIYLLEGHALADRFRPVFDAIERGRLRGLVTPITITEVTTGPLAAGREALAERYRQALTGSPGWAVVAIGAELAMDAARLRGRYRLRLPDAFQLACALRTGCYALVTHDRDFGRVTDLPVLGP